MSTLSYYFIEGQRRNACRNDAVSVVRDEGKTQHVVEIIPAAEIPGKTRNEILHNAPRVFAGTLPRLK